MHELKLLIVDDDEDDRYLFSRALKNVGVSFSLISAENATEALNLLRNDLPSTPDIIFLDINMPGMDGIECLAEIKRIRGLEAVKVIMLTTSNQESDIARCSALGADYWVKPNTTAALAARLNACLEQR